MEQRTQVLMDIAEYNNLIQYKERFDAAVKHNEEYFKNKLKEKSDYYDAQLDGERQKFADQMIKIVEEGTHSLVCLGDIETTDISPITLKYLYVVTKKEDVKRQVKSWKENFKFLKRITKR